MLAPETGALLSRRALALIPVLAAILVIAELPFAQAGVAALAGLALVQALLIALFASAARSLAKDALAERCRPEAATLWTAGLLVSATLLVFACWLRSSHFVWYYDYSTHVLLVRDLIGMVREGGPIAGGLGAVQNSLKFEYNMVPIAPIAFVEALAGQSRMLFILGIALFYAAPTIIAGALLLRRCAPDALGGRMALLILALCALIFPAAFYSALYGQPDLGGAGILATLFLVAFHRAPARFAPMIVCGGLVILLFVFRRWYVFLAPAIVCILAVSEFRRDAGAPALPRLLATARALALFGAFAALCGFAFVWDRFLLMATNDYAGAYLAWANPAAVEIAHALQHFGCLPLALWLACALFLVADRATRLAGAATLATPLFVVALFERVQGFAVHHYLLLIPFMVFAIALAAARLAAARPRAVVAALGLGAAASLFGVSFPGAGTLIQQARLVPTIDMTPPRRDDFAQLDGLARALARHADGGEKICVIAATPILNATVIRETALDLPEAKSLLGENFVWLGEVDRRDKDFLPRNSRPATSRWWPIPCRCASRSASSSWSPFPTPRSRRGPASARPSSPPTRRGA